MLVSSSQRFSGSLKQLMVYVGTAWATALMSTSLPTVDKSFSFHPDNLLATLDFSWAKEFVLDLPMREGRPRYVSCYLITWAPNIVLIFVCISPLVFRLKYNEVFCLFSCCPDDDSYTLRILRISDPLASVALPKIMLSSAKKR